MTLQKIDWKASRAVAVCNLHCFFSLFWDFRNAKCVYERFDTDGRVVFVAATTGSIFDESLKVQKVFLDRTKKEKEDGTEEATNHR